MPGAKSHDFDITYITERVELRSVVAFETDPSIIPADELVTLSEDRHGYNGRIFIPTELTAGISKATVKLYLDVIGDGTVWVLVDSSEITVSTLIQVEDLPPGNYAVLLTALTGAGTVTFYEQHTA